MTDKPQSSGSETGELIFEPHNGFGGNDPDGNPWPLGYISSGIGRPIFELRPVFKAGRAEAERIIKAANRTSLTRTQPQADGEAVAWLYEMAHYIKPSDENPLRDWKQVVTLTPPPTIPKDGVRNVIPLGPLASPTPSETVCDQVQARPNRETLANIIESNIYRKYNGNWDGDFQDLLVAADEILNALRGSQPEPSVCDQTRGADAEYIKKFCKALRDPYEFANADLGKKAANMIEALYLASLATPPTGSSPDQKE